MSLISSNVWSSVADLFCRCSVERPLSRRHQDALFAALKHDGADSRAVYLAALNEDDGEDVAMPSWVASDDDSSSSCSSRRHVPR